MSRKTLLLAAKLALVTLGVLFVARSITWKDAIESRGPLTMAGGMVVPAGRHPVERGADGGLEIAAASGERVRVPGDLLADPKSGVVFRPGVGSTLAGARAIPIGLALLACLATIPLQSVRWWMLLRCRGVEIGLFAALRLFLIGLFFNIVLPGTTGGDVMRAYYATRRPGSRATALASVIVDRGIGMFALVLLGAGAGLFGLRDPSLRMPVLATCVVLLGGVAVTMAFLSPSIRRRFGVDRLIARLPRAPAILALDRAMLAYRSHPGAVAGSVLLAVVTHLLIVSAAYFSAEAIRAPISAGALVQVLPLVLLVGSLPLSVLGLGVMEPTGIVLFGGLGVTPNTIVTVLVLIRLEQMVFWLLGGLCLLWGDERVQEAEGVLNES